MRFTACLYFAANTNHCGSGLARAHIGCALCLKRFRFYAGETVDRHMPR